MNCTEPAPRGGYRFGKLKPERTPEYETRRTVNTDERPPYPVLTSDDLADIRNHQPTAAELNPVCRHCGQDTLQIETQTFKNGSVHRRGTCTVCKKFSHWVPA